MGNYNVEMFWHNDVSRQVFYVRPFSEEVKADLERLVKDCKKVCGNVAITEKNGTYAISTDEKITKENFRKGLWGILFVKFLNQSHEVCVDPINEEKYYAVIFSESFIAPCERRLAA